MAAPNINLLAFLRPLVHILLIPIKLIKVPSTGSTVACISFFEPCMHLVIQVFIYGVFYLFIVGSSSDTACTQRTVTALFSRAAILLFIVAFLVLIGFLVR